MATTEWPQLMRFSRGAPVLNNGQPVEDCAALEAALLRLLGVLFVRHVSVRRLSSTLLVPFAFDRSDPGQVHSPYSQGQPITYGIFVRALIDKQMR